MGYKAKMKVRFSDVDNAGIVYYPRFFHYFHVAFEEFFSDELSTPYPEVLQKDRVGFPVVNVSADFHVPITFGDNIEIEVLVDRIGTKSARFAYLLRKVGDDTVRAEAKITVACIDMETFKAEPIPPKYRKLFEAYAGQGTG